MTAQKFDDIVKARANERVQAKIKEFKRAVYAELNKLIRPGNYSPQWTFPARLETNERQILEILTAEDNTKGWPEYLWEREKEIVSKELFSIMDEMQKALIAAGGPIVYENEMKVKDPEK